MVKDSREVLAALREEVQARARGRCEWPGCGSAGEQMAHLEHRGAGGSREVNRIDNVAWLCVWHHDLLDRREVRGTRREVRILLGAYLVCRGGEHGRCVEP